VPTNISEQVKKIRQYTKTPIAIGFGISNARQVATVAQDVYGVTIVNALISELSNVDTAVQNAAAFMEGIVNYE